MPWRIHVVRPIPETVLNSTFELARYGAFPTETTWYITAGAFPENNDGVNGKATAGTADGTQRRRVTHRLSVSHENYVIEQPSTSSSGTAPFWHHFEPFLALFFKAPYHPARAVQYALLSDRAHA